MSDIHGCYDDFLTMLEQINFNDDDQLILAGDYIDRGSQSFEMLKWIENAPDNVLLIKGNHEAEFAQCIEILISFIKKLNISVSNSEELLKVYSVLKDDFKDSMFDYYETIKALLIDHNVTLFDLQNWKSLIDDMSYYFKITINKRKHIIVHAGYIPEEYFKKVHDQYDDVESFYIYAREDSLKYGGQKDSTIIFGHTPTVIKGGFYNNGYVYKYIDSKKNCTFYNIDCGKVYYSEKYTNAKLACIRLEDKRVFYI